MRRGFTMIEIMVVVGILVVLSGIIFAAGTAAVDASLRNKTRATLDTLSTTLVEWESTTARTLTWGVDGQAGNGSSLPGSFYDMQEGTAVGNTLGEAMATFGKGDTRNMLAAIPDDLFTLDSQGRRTLVDAWEEAIIIVHPGRDWAAGDALPGPDDDGTVRTPLEDTFGVCVNARPYFLSGGPDRDPATIDDNLYSYDPAFP